MSAPATVKDPRRYFEEVSSQRSTTPAGPPVCLYLEVTNRCNLRCRTCPQFFGMAEPFQHAVTQHGRRLRLYTPVGDLLQACAIRPYREDRAPGVRIVEISAEGDAAVFPVVRRSRG